MNLRKIKEKFAVILSSEFGGLAVHDKVYKFGAITFFIYLGIGVISILMFGQEGLNVVASIFTYGMTMIFAVAVSIEYSLLLKNLYTKSWFKWLLGVIAVLVYKYSDSCANDFINDFVEIDPGLLPTASSILAMLFLPYSWLLAVSSFLSIYILICWMFFPFEPQSGQRQLGQWKFLARFFGLFFVFIVIAKSAALFENKESFFSLFSKHVVLSTEYFKKSNCLNVSPGERVADIGNSYISIYNANSGKFRTELCRLESPDASGKIH